MQEQAKNQVSPTEQMLLFLEEASQDKSRWKMIKGFIAENEVWQRNLKQSGVNLDQIRERIKEIDQKNRQERPGVDQGASQTY